MALSADEQDLFDHARASLPRWLWSDERANEELGLLAKTIGAALGHSTHWLRAQAYILTAVGATSSEPDWLAAHARDRGTSRFAGESDTALRQRVRNVGDSLTPPMPYMSLTPFMLYFSIADTMASLGMVGNHYALELPRDQAYFGILIQSGGIGGTFAPPYPEYPSYQSFTPTVPFAMPPYVNPSLGGRVRGYQIVISDAADPANNGTFLITAIIGNTVIYTNGGELPPSSGADPGAIWSLRRLDYMDNVLDFRAHSYMSRGDRMGRARGGTIIVILTFPATEAQRRAIEEMLRQRKAGGVVLIVERRAIP